MQSEEDAEFYKSALKKDEARKRRNRACEKKSVNSANLSFL